MCRHEGDRSAVALVVAVTLLLGLLFGAVTAERAAAATLPPGFQESVVFTGLTNPTAVRFSPDGRVFVAEKSGIIKVFDNLTDTTPSVYADLRTKVHSFNDRGLLGLALDPSFPTVQDIYVSYAHDAPIGGTAPVWGQPDTDADGCPTPPGPNLDGCVISGRLSRLRVGGGSSTAYDQAVLADSPRALLATWRVGGGDGSGCEWQQPDRAPTSNTPTLGAAGALAGKREHLGRLQRDLRARPGAVQLGPESVLVLGRSVGVRHGRGGQISVRRLQPRLRSRQHTRLHPLRGGRQHLAILGRDGRCERGRVSGRRSRSTPGRISSRPTTARRLACM